MGFKTFRDAVHGDMLFSDEEIQVIDTFPMQRLRGIKQLGSSNLVYPSAVHTRFEHSLGVCWTAKRMLRAMADHYGIKVSRQDARRISLAALLHDVTHIPYGHTFEDERLVFPRHDEDCVRLELFFSEPDLAKALEGTGLKAEIAETLLVKDHFSQQKPYVSQIVSYTICADLLDYLRRDSFFCGLAHSYDDRIFRYFTLVDNALVIDLQKGGLLRPDAISEVIHLLRIRYLLTERVYFHHAKVAAGVMISKAVEMAVSLGLEPSELYWLGDETLLFHLRRRFAGHLPLETLLDQFERRILIRKVFLLTRGVGQERQATLVARYRDNLAGCREKAEAELAGAVGIPPAAVTIYCPAEGVALKEAQVRVLVDGGPPVSLVDLHNQEVEAISEKYRDLWRFYVFVDGSYEERAVKLARTCEEFFDARNQLPMRMMRPG